MPRFITLLIGWLLALTLSAAVGHAVGADGGDAGGLGQQVADTYGFADWDAVEVLGFTFNVQTPERRVARRWTWRPKENLVTLEVEGAEPITYRRDEIADDTPESVRQADRQFINDSYWLLFPFQLVWSNPAITDAGQASLPIGEGEGHKLVVRYPAEGGYTPGDAYDLYLDDAGLIVQWVYRGGGGEDGRAMTWENNLNLGPIKVSSEHRNEDGSFRLWFSGLSLKTSDAKNYP